MAIKIYNGAGQEVTPPKSLSASFCRDTFFSHDRVIKHEFSEFTGNHVHKIEAGNARYQVPWVVLLMQYDSKMQMMPQQREYFLYAPAKENMASGLAYDLWRMWVKKLRPGQVRYDVASEDDFPKIMDAMIAHPIDDKTFDEAWRAVRKLDPSKRKQAGQQDDPFAFTSLDDSVMLFRTDQQTDGLITPH